MPGYIWLRLPTPLLFMEAHPVLEFVRNTIFVAVVVAEVCFLYDDNRALDIVH